jgi:hypothetical protein
MVLTTAQSLISAVERALEQSKIHRKDIVARGIYLNLAKERAHEGRARAFYSQTSKIIFFRDKGFRCFCPQVGL